MANIVTFGNRADKGKFVLSRTDERMLTLVKTRHNGSCCICENIIASKSYCLGSGYCKVCMSCHEKFLNKFISSLEDYKNKIKDSISDIKNKSSEIIKNNMLAKVNYKPDY